MLRYGQEYVRQSEERYEQAYQLRLVKSLAKRAPTMGYKLVPETATTRRVPWERSRSAAWRKRRSIMSRSITIGYRDLPNGRSTPIEVRPPYFLLGGQDTSKRFWRIPKLKEIGITQLS